MKRKTLVLQFNAQEDKGVPFHRNYNSILRRDHQKNCYERRAFEPIGVYLGLCPKKRRKIEFGPQRVKESENFQITLTF